MLTSTSKLLMQTTKDTKFHNLGSSLLILKEHSLFPSLHQESFSNTLSHLLTSKLQGSKMELLSFQPITNQSSLVITILKLELKLTVIISMELEKDSKNRSEKKMVNGQSSIEIEGRSLTKELDCKLMDTIHSIC